MGSLFGASISGVRITLVSTIVSGLVQVVILVVLARLLTPSDFGVFVLAMAVPKLTTLFFLGAVERTLVVYRQFDRLEAFTLPTCIATLIGAVAVAAVLSAASTFPVVATPSREAVWGTLAASVVSSLAVMPRVHLRRRLRFGYIAMADLIAQVLGLGAMTILGATLGWGAMALVAGALAQAVIVALVLAIATHWRIRWRLAFAAMLALLAKVAGLARASILETLTGQTPTIAVAHLFGATGLGIFNRAYALTQLPIELMTTSLSRVLVSGFVAVQDEGSRLRGGLLNLVRVAVAATTPLAGGVFGAHAQLVTIVLGPKWEQSSGLVPFLIIAAWGVMSAHLFAVFTEATQRFGEKVRVQASSLVVLISCLFLGSVFGLVGSAAGFAVSALIHLGLYLRLAAKVAGLTVWSVLQCFAPCIMAGTLCAVYTSMIPSAVDADVIVLLAIQVAGCGAISLLYYAAFHRELVHLVLRFVGLRTA